MKKVFYEKVGRRYKPISEYDSDFLSSFHKGNYLVMCYPGGKSTRYNVDPNYAALIAAGRVAEDAMSKAIGDASEMRLRKRKDVELTPAQRAAWENLIAVFGEEAKYLEYASARDVAEAGLKALQEEADKLMKYDAVKLAFDHFVMVCEICKESERV